MPLKYRLLIALPAVFGIVTFARAEEPASKAQPNWTKRTPDGQPDIQGYWSNATITPFERPVALAGKTVLTEEEATRLEEQARKGPSGAAPREGDVGAELWSDRGSRIVKTRQTSLVVDPPDGRVPLSAAAQAQRDFNKAHETDSYTYMSVWDRCITRGTPSGMFPSGHNNAYQIIQTPGRVIIVSEMIHEARVIPLDGSPHPPSNVRLWDGDARGHWEGNTLVVDTTNFNGKSSIATSAVEGRLRGIPQSEAMHIVERFTRTEADTLTYELAVDDPPMYTQPWKVLIPLAREENYQMYEYACHEGNEAVKLILGGARAQGK